MSRNVQYITDEHGQRTAVILPINEYENLLADLHLTRVSEKRKDEPCHPLSDVVADLRKTGEIDV